MNVNSFQDRENAQALPSNRSIHSFHFVQLFCPSIHSVQFVHSVSPFRPFIQSCPFRPFIHSFQNKFYHINNQYLTKSLRIKKNLALWWNRHLHLARLWISSFIRDQKLPNHIKIIQNSQYIKIIEYQVNFSTQWNSI